jgi:iron complex outermembrane receptor protein
MALVLDSGFAADKIPFDIPRQKANTALTVFARQAGVSVLFPSDPVRDLTANGLVGEYSADEGLRILLEGTGLDAALNAAGQLTVRVVPAEAEAEPNRPARPAVALADRARNARRQAQDARSEGVQEIVVTARRREENLQDVPVSIVSLSGDQLEVRGLQTIEQLSGAVPNVSLIGGAFGVNQSSFTMRGIPRVSTFVDGIWQVASAGLLLKSIVDVDRIEVLRGPQGTLFGRDSTGGALRIVTRRPEAAFGANVSATVGAFGRRDVQLAVDVPVTETLHTKWTGASLNRDGYVESVTLDRDFGSLENDVFRADMVWIPTGRFDLRLIYERNTQRSNGQPRLIEAILPGLDTSPIRLNVVEQLLAAGYTFTNGSHVSGYPGGRLGRWQTRMDAELDSTDIDYAQYTLDMNWNVRGAINVQSLTGFRRQYTKDLTDWDASETDMIEDDRRFLDRDWSQEFQLSGGSGRLHWVTGLYFWNNESLNRFFRFAYTEFKTGALDFEDVIAACQPPAGGDDKAGCSIFPNQDFGSRSRNEGSAAFGEVQIDLTDRLALTVGSRFHDERQFSATRVFSTPGPIGPDLDAPGDLFAGDDASLSNASFDHFTRRLALNYRVANEVTLYAGYAEGYNSGGVARLTEPDPSTGVNVTFLYPYAPENIDNYELGVRSDWFERRLRLNATVFFTEWENIQLAGAAPDPFNPGQYLQRTLTSNVAAARAKGVEIELRMAAALNWEGDLNLGVLDTAYTDVSPLTTDVSLGDTFGQAPELTFSAGVQKTWRLGGSGELLWRFDYAYIDEFTRSRVPGFQRAKVTGTTKLEAGAYGLANTRLRYRPAEESWELSLFGTNLTNERYLNSGHTIPMWGWDMGTVGRPREWGATLRVFLQ